MKEKIESLSRIVHLKWVKAKYEADKSSAASNAYWKGQELAYKEVKDHLDEMLKEPATPEANSEPVVACTCGNAKAVSRCRKNCRLV